MSVAVVLKRNDAIEKTYEKQFDTSLPESKPSALDLRGRQSVRATFHRYGACIEAIPVLSAHLESNKNKLVFNHLLEDAQVLICPGCQILISDYKIACQHNVSGMAHDRRPAQ